MSNDRASGTNRIEPLRDRAFDALLSALIDDELTEEQAAELRVVLRRDPAARAAYIDAMAFEALLREEFPERSEADEDLPLALPDRRRSWWSGVWPATVGVAAALVIGLFGFLAQSNRLPAGAVALETAPEGTALARVTRVTEGAMDGAQRPFAPGHVLEVGEVDVLGAPVEITFNSGAVVTMEPGARMRLDGEQQAFLLAGKVSATVPEHAQGFAIDTVRSRIVDLGTSFNLEVSPDGDTELRVLDGLVETSVDNASAVRLVRENESIRIASDGIEQGAVSWPVSVVTADGPAWDPADTYAHWSFDHPARTYFLEDHGTHRLALLDNGSEVRNLPSRVVPGAFRGALQFNGASETATCLTLDGLRGDAPRTTACWVRLPREAAADRPNGMILWGHPDRSAGTWVMNWNTRPQDGRVGALRQELGDGYVVGSTDLRDGRWHHVTAVYLGGASGDVNSRVKLYVDGRLEAVSGSSPQSVEALAGAQDGGTRALMLGGYPGEDRTWTLDGALDEVYVFDGALTPAQIVQLMSKNAIQSPEDVLVASETSP